jgi:hypothetical protein
MQPEDINLDINWDEVVAWSNSGAPEAKDLWSKLTDQERQFYLQALERNMQSRGDVEKNRADNNLLGAPPELAAFGAAKFLPTGALMGAIQKFFGGKTDDVLGKADTGAMHGPAQGGFAPPRWEPATNHVKMRPMEQADEVAEQVGRGVTNDFRGQVSIQRKGQLGAGDTSGLRSQPNVSAKRTVEDVREQVSKKKPHADSRDWDNDEYPLGEDPATAEAQRKIAAKLDKKPVRRKK